VSLAALLVRPTTIVHPGETVDRYGNSIPDWVHPTTTLTMGWLAQQGGSEDRQRRDAEVSNWSLVLPAEIELSALDRVIIGTTTYELVAPPNEAWTPRGPHHIEATLRLVEG
jgi:hypothetical protein